MAIITEEQEPEPHQQQQNKQDHTKKHKKHSTSQQNTTKPNPKPQSHNKTNPFTFWFYVTLSVSLVTLILITLSSLSTPSDPKSFFLSLSSPLRHHYSKGRVIKVQLQRNNQPIEVFAFEGKKSESLTEKVVIVHGLGLNSFAFRKVVDGLGSRGVHGVVFDLPGHGFSDKSMEVVEERGDGVFERFFDVYRLIREKGVFWAFDNMVESGQIPYDVIQSYFESKERNVVRPVALGSEEIGRVLGQVIETLGLAPVHLVLHDSSLGMVANWVSKNPGLVRSLTLVDTGLRPALPLWALETPVIREVVLGSKFVYEILVRSCCSRGISSLDLDAYRMILRGRDGRKSVVAIAKHLNASFNVAEWGGMDEIKGTPMQVIWSGGWAEDWGSEGHKVAEALPQAKFVSHSGSRWPQDNNADELAEVIVNFVSTLPKTIRRVEEEQVPEHIQKLLDEAKEGNHHHHHGHDGHHHHDHHGHAHMPGAGYMDAYGLGHGWGT